MSTFTTANKMSAQLNHLVTQIQAQPTPSDTHTILTQLQALQLQFAQQIQHHRADADQTSTQNQQQLQLQQQHVYQLTLARDNLNKGVNNSSLAAFDQARQDVVDAQTQLEALQTTDKTSEATRSQQLGMLAKGEADTMLWIAQVLSSTDPKKANVYFRVCIQRYRGLYGVTTDKGRDHWLKQLPDDASKIVSACQMSPAVLSALNGVVGEASALVARAQCTLHGCIEDKDKSTGTAFQDFATGFQIYRRLGNVPEVVHVLRSVVRFRRVLGQYRCCAIGEHMLIHVLQSLQDFGGMVRAGMNESMYCVLAAQHPEEKVAPSRLAAVFPVGAKPYLHEESGSEALGSEALGNVEVDSEKAKRGWVQRYLRLAASAANTSVAMCTMIEEQGLGKVLEGGGDSGEGGGLKCAAHYQLSKVYQLAWETSKKGGQLPVSVSLWSFLSWAGL